MSQNDLLLKTMLEGRKVTRVTALSMGVMNLTARIANLRARGHDVRCAMKTDTLGRKYGEFFIA